MAASSSLAVSPSRPSRARSTRTAWSSFSSQAWLKFRLGLPTPLTRRRWPSGMPHRPCSCSSCRRAGRTPKTRTPIFECHKVRTALAKTLCRGGTDRDAQGLLDNWDLVRSTLDGLIGVQDAEDNPMKSGGMTSLAFYGAIGFEQVGRVDLGDGVTLTMLKFPADEVVTLELVHRPPDGPVVIGSGFSHLAVQVDDLSGMIEAVTKAGLSAGPVERPGGLDGAQTSWLRDPDGYRIELVQWPPGHAYGITAADFG